MLDGHKLPPSFTIRYLYTIPLSVKAKISKAELFRDLASIYSEIRSLFGAVWRFMCVAVSDTEPTYEGFYSLVEKIDH